MISELTKFFAWCCFTFAAANTVADAIRFGLIGTVTLWDVVQWLIISLGWYLWWKLK